MKRFFQPTLLITAFMAALFGDARALPNCQHCSGSATCKTGGDGTCIRSCSDGVCICGTNETEACTGG